MDEGSVVEEAWVVGEGEVVEEGVEVEEGVVVEEGVEVEEDVVEVVVGPHAPVMYNGRRVAVVHVVLLDPHATAY